MKTKALLKAIAVIELMTGVGLLLVPSLVTELLLGAPLSPVVPLVVGHVAGAALAAIGLTCRLEAVSDREGSPNALLIGLLSYNVAIPLLLVYAYVVNKIGGIGLWLVVILHLTFSVWIGACIRRYSTALGRSL
jgi:hypothetical protein